MNEKQHVFFADPNFPNHIIHSSITQFQGQEGDNFSSFISVFLLQPILILHYSPGKDRHYISLYCLGSACKRKYRSLLLSSVMLVIRQTSPHFSSWSAGQISRRSLSTGRRWVSWRRSEWEQP